MNKSLILKPEISIVIPVFNEAAILKPLIESTLSVMRSTGLPFEVILIDDGSTDGTQEVLRSMKNDNVELRAIFLRRNFGQSAAMTAGFDHAKGNIVVTMDGDFQNDPKDIPHMVAKLEEGYDLVCGWRKERKDPFFSRRLPSTLANWLIGWTTGVKLHDYGCTLKVYKGQITRHLNLYGELHRFIPVLFSLFGSRITEVPVGHHPRRTGKSKYGIIRTYRVVLDLLLMLFFQKFATQPLKFFGLNGGLLFCTGFVIEIYLSWLKLWHGVSIGGRPLLVLGVLLIITGIVLFGIGLLAELLVRVYYESSGKRIYTVREIID